MIQNLRSLAHNTFLRARNLERLINSVEFEEISKTVTEQTLEEIRAAIIALNIDKIKAILQREKNKNMETMEWKVLRALAQQYCIPSYSRLTREELIEELKKCNIPKN